MWFCGLGDIIIHGEVEKGLFVKGETFICMSIDTLMLGSVSCKVRMQSFFNAFISKDLANVFKDIILLFWMWEQTISKENLASLA